jgi:hypothetical protein
MRIVKASLENRWVKETKEKFIEIYNKLVKEAQGWNPDTVHDILKPDGNLLEGDLETKRYVNQTTNSKFPNTPKRPKENHREFSEDYGSNTDNGVNRATGIFGPKQEGSPPFAGKAVETHKQLLGDAAPLNKETIGDEEITGINKDYHDDSLGPDNGAITEKKMTRLREIIETPTEEKPKVVPPHVSRKPGWQQQKSTGLPVSKTKGKGNSKKR